MYISIFALTSLGFCINANLYSSQAPARSMCGCLFWQRWHISAPTREALARGVIRFGIRHRVFIMADKAVPLLPGFPSPHFSAVSDFQVLPLVPSWDFFHWPILGLGSYWCVCLKPFLCVFCLVCPRIYSKPWFVPFHEHHWRNFVAPLWRGRWGRGVH